MPKLKPVTDAELLAALDTGHAGQAHAADLERRLQTTLGQGDITEWAARAVAALSISQAFATLAQTCMSRAALDEQRREIERLQRERGKRT